MTFTSLDLLACFATATFLAFVHVCLSRKNASGLPHPPGPPGWPVLGNMLDIPRQLTWLKYMEWGRIYGSDIIRLDIIGTNVIVLNSLEVATDLFDKRSSIYNDRPYMTMLNDLIGLGWAMSFQPYGDRWRDMRRAFHQQLGSESARDYHEIETNAARELLRRLLRQPDGFMEHIRHMAGRTIMRTAYGIDILSENDPYIKLAEESLQGLSAATNAGAYLVDSIPILKYLPEWFPGAHFQKEARVWRPPVFQLLHRPFDQVKSTLAEGGVHPCAATSLLEGMVKASRDPVYMESVVRSTLGSMYLGGADTTVSSLGSFILAMVLHPEIQREAQKQIDSVVGIDRLPDFSDRVSLPYIDALVNESLRWHPVLPLDIPHRLSSDDVYRGYFIPKGSLVVANAWAILHDEAAYPDPLRFNPDRFLRDGAWDAAVRDPAIAAFGFGRRICPGRFMAKDSMWITIASVLSCFEIGQAVGEDGEPVIPKEEYAAGLVSYPLPFKCAIRPRSPIHQALIMDSLDKEV